MGRLEVDTQAVAACGTKVGAAGHALIAAHGVLGRAQSASGETGDPSADAAIEAFVQSWGASVAALAQAAASASAGATAASQAYTETDRGTGF